METSLLASQMALPCEAHLDAIFHVFGYLKCRPNARMVFDPTYPQVEKNNFLEHDWTEFYGDVKEPVPDDAPNARGKEVDLRLFMDSDHACDKHSHNHEQDSLCS